MHAFITDWPSVVECRLEDGSTLSEPKTQDAIAAYGRLLSVLIERGVDTIEIRVENTDD
jgi:hypothetical protein